MRTITTTLYKFYELSDEAKAKAIENEKYQMMENESYEALLWAVDDCSLLEPPHQEMVELLGEDYYDQNRTPDGKYGQFVFKNNRKGINVDLDDRNLIISKALTITNDEMFLTWLGFPKELHPHVDYYIRDSYHTFIEFSPANMEEDDPRFPELEKLFSKAEDKFSDHMDYIIDKIQAGYDEYFSDDNIDERLRESDLEFEEDGSVY